MRSRSSGARTYFFAVIATHSVPPLTLVLLRVALAAMVLVPIVLLMGFRLPDTIATWRSLAILAIAQQHHPLLADVSTASRM